MLFYCMQPLMMLEMQMLPPEITCCEGGLGAFDPVEDRKRADVTDL